MFVFFSSRRRHTRCALVTGVQTCALPIFMENIWPNVRIVPIDAELPLRMLLVHAADRPQSDVSRRFAQVLRAMYRARSEERRVGKGCVCTCRSRGSPLL